MKHIFVIALASIAVSMSACTNEMNKSGSEQTSESALENTKEAAQEVLEDTQKVAKKSYRDVKDKTCEMVNGKMECIAKEAVNKVKNAADSVKDKVNDIKKEQ